ncbi:MAG: GNAT family N-acetyltransferase [Ardenticatenaceae bacterium]
MSASLLTRRLGSEDETVLRAFWACEAHANLLAISDLDHLGWRDSRLSYTGWFDGEKLVAYLMLFGGSAQWHYSDACAVPGIATTLEEAEWPVEFVTGLESTAWPVLGLLKKAKVIRHVRSIIASLSAIRFNLDMIRAVPGVVRQARLTDLDAITAVHIAAPDQFNQWSYGVRRRILRGVLTDGWRRLYLGQTPAGEVVSAAQTTAEGKEIAVVAAVVTHPSFRGLGYATATTACLCAALLEEGKVPYLYYRRDNAAALRVYQKIGFLPLGDGLLAVLEWG